MAMQDISQASPLATGARPPANVAGSSTQISAPQPRLARPILPSQTEYVESLRAAEPTPPPLSTSQTAPQLAPPPNPTPPNTSPDPLSQGPPRIPRPDIPVLRWHPGSPSESGQAEPGPTELSTPVSVFFGSDIIHPGSGSGSRIDAMRRSSRSTEGSGSQRNNSSSQRSQRDSGSSGAHGARSRSQRDSGSSAGAVLGTSGLASASHSRRHSGGSTGSKQFPPALDDGLSVVYEASVEHTHSDSSKPPTAGPGAVAGPSTHQGVIPEEGDEEGAGASQADTKSLKRPTFGDHGFEKFKSAASVSSVGKAAERGPRVASDSSGGTHSSGSVGKRSGKSGRSAKGGKSPKHLDPGRPGGSRGGHKKNTTSSSDVSPTASQLPPNPPSPRTTQEPPS